MIHAAALSGADCIIIPDVGCGVFKNDPKVCGKILGEVLFNYSTRFKRAVISGLGVKLKSFYDAAMDAMKAASASGVVPITADAATSSCLVPIDEKAHLIVGKCVVCKRGL